MTTRGLLFLLSGALLTALAAALNVRVFACLSAVIGFALVYGFLCVWLSRQSTRLFFSLALKVLPKTSSILLRMAPDPVLIIWRNCHNTSCNIGIVIYKL